MRNADHSALAKLNEDVVGRHTLMMALRHAQIRGRIRRSWRPELPAALVWISLGRFKLNSGAAENNRPQRGPPTPVDPDHRPGATGSVRMSPRRPSHQEPRVCKGAPPNERPPSSAKCDPGVVLSTSVDL
jgi:hypothetical protein